jgi:GNAT superfamily N-acetyltransferase
MPEAWPHYLADIMDVRSRWGDADLIVAEENGRLAGTVTLWLKKGRTSRETWPDYWAGIRLLGVHPDFRGRGVGQLLMKECIRRCRQAGVKTLALHTTNFMDAARRMYEIMGFQRVPEYDFHPAPGVIIMAYKLEL